MESGDDYEGEDDFVYAEYTIDDSLNSIERLEKYCKSDFSLQRLVLVREIYDTAVETGYSESKQRLLPLLNTFVADQEPAVRQVFAEQLFPLASFFLHSDGDLGYDELLNTFIPYAFELIIDKNLEVGQAAMEALLRMSGLIKREHVESHLLSVIVNLAHDERVEEYRIAAARLFNELAAPVGEKLCREVIIDELILLSDDPSLLVRKTVAQHVGKICKIVGADTTVNKMLPPYLNLCRDDIWGVRKACVEALPSVALCVPLETRSSKVAQMFKSFADDVSRWVKIEAYKQLGPLIATLKESPDGVPKELIQHFLSMALAGEHDSEMIESCAFNFPAIVYTLGKTKWHLLEATYLALTKDVQWKVRKTLAHSLHEIAAILGREISETVLTQAFELFVKDLDEVKTGVIDNLVKFLQYLGRKTRIKYLSTICALPEENENWRIRQDLARQLGSLSQLYPLPLVRSHLLKLVQTLILDAFAEVRNTAITSAGIVLKRLSQGDVGGERDFMQFMVSLSKGKYFYRQMFVKGCQSIFEQVDPKFFEAEFFPLVVQLATDKVANVRAHIAILLNSMLQSEYFKDNPKIMELLATMKQDKDRDVSYFSTYCIMNTSSTAVQDELNEAVNVEQEEDN